MKKNINSGYNFTVLHRDTPVAHVCVSENHKDVIIEKFVPDGIIQPFSGTKLDIERVYNFLKDRCYEDSYAGINEVLLKQNMTSNNPWEWNKKTHGVTWEDFFWIKFDGEDISWEDVLWRK